MSACGLYYGLLSFAEHWAESVANLAAVGFAEQGFVQSAGDVKECRKHCKGKDIKAGGPQCGRRGKHGSMHMMSYAYS